MPYVGAESKLLLGNGALPSTAGELTYSLTLGIQGYLDDCLLRRGGLHYEDLATVLGALDGARADFIRRVLEPYEKRKQKANGDVWPDRMLGNG